MQPHVQLSARTTRVALVATTMIWLCAVCVGIALLTSYGNTPGPVSNNGPSWPTGSRLELSQNGSTLVLFAHPHCPCTRATLGELEKVAATQADKLNCWVVFVKPASVEDGWDQTDLWKTAESIPGVHIVQDVDGVEARRFGATTSGQTILYSQRGERIFSGGITFARGHSGDNAGRTAIQAYLNDGSSKFSQTPVFGCPLETPRAAR